MTTIPAQTGTQNPQTRAATQGGAAPTSGFGAVDPLKLLQKHKWLLAGSAVVGGLVGLAAHFAWFAYAPIFKPTVIFEVSPPVRNAADTPEIMGGQEEFNRFMSTQKSRMTDDGVLNRVATSTELPNKAKKWSQQFYENGSFNSQEALKELRDIVDSRIVTGTQLIELSVTYSDKYEATDIVKLVSTKYREVLEEQGRRSRDSRTLSLREGIERAQAQIDQRTTERDTLVRQNKIESIRSAVEAVQTDLRSVSEELKNVELAITALRKQQEQMEAEFNNPAGISYSDELRGEVDEDALVLDIKQQIAILKSSQQALLLGGKTSEHRAYLRYESQIKAQEDTLATTKAQLLKQKFESQLDGIRSEIRQREAQQAKLSADKTELETRSTQLASLDGRLTDIDTAIKTLLTSKAESEKALSNVKMLDSLENANRVIVWRDATVPNEVAFPKLAFMLPLGILLTVGLVGGGVIAREILDQRVKGPGDITLMPRTRLIGWVPDAAEDPSGQGAVETAFRDRSRGVVAESYRQIRVALSKRLEAAGHRSLLVVSGMPGSGATTTISNLALAFAAAEKRVLIIDANFRRPAVNRVFGLPESPGLGDCLAKNAELANAIQATSTPGVEVLTAGTKESRVVERLGTAGFSTLLSEASAKYDLVLIDCAPVIVAGDGLTIAHRCDASMVVVRAFGEKRGLVARIRNELTESRSEFLGVLVNSVRASAGGYLRGNFRATQEYQQS